MISMEGLMLVPPERGTIIGRALWKPRYVVLGSGSRTSTQNENKSPYTVSSDRTGAMRKGPNSTASKPNLADLTDMGSEDQGLYITIYKAKGDWEYLTQYPLSSLKAAEIRSVAHRKQGPTLPTLMIDLKPEQAADKQRRRRSSRTGGLTGKDPWANTLLFRTVPEERYNIYDWQMTLKGNIKPETPDNSAFSPVTPTFHLFSNPFGTRSPSSAPRPEYLRGPSNNGAAASKERERPSALISPSPSLRSRRSDLSSQTSSSQPQMAFPPLHLQNHAALPTDLPSPATSGYDTPFIEGWTSAQGRSSALSSHTRGSNSIASAVTPATPFGATPPGPRETILDRAFQMRCIPGSDKVQDKDELSSIARFEALMREVDERKQQKAKEAQDTNPTSAWDPDEDSEESDMDEPLDEDDDDEEEGLDMSDQEITMPTPAQRALEYISGRHTPAPPHQNQSQRPLSPPPRSPPIPFLHQNQQALHTYHVAAPTLSHNNNGGLRPRTNSQLSRPSLAVPIRSFSTASLSQQNEASSNNTKEERRNSTSAKRLSFTEFTRRLSSTSSLLLVQTNTSSSGSGRGEGSRRGSGEFGFEGEGGRKESFGLGLRGGGDGGVMAMGERERELRCGWRGSVGVFGAEGTFI